MCISHKMCLDILWDFDLKKVTHLKILYIIHARLSKHISIVWLYCNVTYLCLKSLFLWLV